MSVDLYLDQATHDIKLGRAGDAQIVGGAERVAQQIQVTLLTFLGEWFLDETFGVPYLEKVMVKAPNRAELESVLRAKVKAVPGVQFIPLLKIEIDARTRRARITMEGIQTNEGLMPLITVMQ